MFMTMAGCTAWLGHSSLAVFCGQLFVIELRHNRSLRMPAAETKKPRQYRRRRRRSSPPPSPLPTLIIMILMMALLLLSRSHPFCQRVLTVVLHVCLIAVIAISVLLAGAIAAVCLLDRKEQRRSKILCQPAERSESSSVPPSAI